MKEEKDNSVVVCSDKNGKDVIIKEESRYLGTLIIGSPGSGKTQGILIPMAKQDIKNKRGVTIFDKTGALSEAAYVYARSNRRKIHYINSKNKKIRFNPIKGTEDEVIDRLVFVFKKRNQESSRFFIDIGVHLISNSVKVIKRLKGNSATLIDLSTLIHNSQGQGKIMVNSFSRLNTDTVEMAEENNEIASWFFTEYFNEKSKTYENTADVRAMFCKIFSNKNAKMFLDTRDKDIEEINFDKHIKNKEIVIINIKFDYGPVDKILETLLFHSYQSAIFKQNREQYMPNFLYIDGYYSFFPLLNQFILRSRPHKIAVHLAIQNFSLLNKIEYFFSSNMGNLILLPGLSLDNAELLVGTFIGKFSLTDMLYMNFGETLYNIIDKTFPGYRNINIGKINFTDREEQEFIYKRMKAYEKQFLKTI